MSSNRARGMSSQNARPYAGVTIRSLAPHSTNVGIRIRCSHAASRGSLTALLDLRDKRVLLTGGSQGIGAAGVRALHAAGARVMFTYRTRDDLAQALCTELGAGVSARYADLADADAPTTATAQ